MAVFFRARYASRCAADCGNDIEPGDDVTYVDDRLAHVECSDTLAPARPEHPVSICPTCHLTLPCDCEDPS